MQETTPADDPLWSSRSQHWRDKAGDAVIRRAKYHRERSALILSGFGVSLRLEGGTLQIRNGFTHHPQKQETIRYFKGDLDLPERIILLDCSGSISLAVITWLSAQNVTLLSLSWDGTITSVASPTGYAANPFRVQWQRRTREDPTARMAFSRSLIISKIEGSIKALEKITYRTGSWEPGMRTAYAILERLDENQVCNIEELRGLEGVAAAAYFRAWHGVPVGWRKDVRRPIPLRWRVVNSRHSNLQSARKQSASHPIQAIINYAYKCLETYLRLYAISEGYDPCIGVMHEKRADFAAFLYDLIEINRYLIDIFMIRFLQENQFCASDFVIREDGVCRLNADFARYISREITSLYDKSAKQLTSAWLHTQHSRA